MSALSIDVGTSVIKAVVYDDTGREITVARRDAPLLRGPRGHSEQDMHQVWGAVVAVVREVAGSCPRPDHLAITGQGDGAWLVDAAGRPVRPAVLWNDARAADLVGEWRRQGLEDKAYAVCGSALAPGLPHAILSWFHAHEPEALDRATACLTCSGWIHRCLTGVDAIHISEASNPFLDLTAGDYSDEVLDLFDLGWAAALRPRVIGAGDEPHTLTTGAAATLGLPVGTPVVLAPYDVVCAAYGSGVHAVGDACLILGTTLCAETFLPTPVLCGPVQGIQVLSGHGTVLRALPTLSGVEVFGWAASVLGAAGPAEVVALAARGTAHESGLAFHPYLSPAGERAPFQSPVARGSFLGLTSRHTAADLARAVLEGLSCAARECVEALTPGEAPLRVCGGAAANDAWLRMIADVTGRTVVRPAAAEVGTQGARLHAEVTMGRAASIGDEYATLPHADTVVEPDAATRASYDRLYEGFLELRDVLTRTWPITASLAADDAR